MSPVMPRRDLIDDQTLLVFGSRVTGLIGNIGLHRIATVAQRLRLCRCDVDRPSIAGDQGIERHDIGAVHNLDGRGLAIFNAAGGAANAKAGGGLSRVDNIVSCDGC